MIKEYINLDNCSEFEQFMLYIMCYLKEDDLRKEMNEDKISFMPLGEMDHYCRFGIDWSKSKFQDLINLEDNDPRWKIENKFQEVAIKAKELYNAIEKNR